MKPTETPAPVVPTADEVTIAWTGQRCRVSFDGVETVARLESTDNDRYGTDVPPAIVDRNRPDGNGGFHAEAVSENLPKRYALATAKTTLEGVLVAALISYLYERKLDAEQQTVDAPVTVDDVRKLLPADLVDTLEGNPGLLAGTVTATTRGTKTERAMVAAFTMPESPDGLVLHLTEDHVADGQQFVHKLRLEVKTPYLWAPAATVTLEAGPGVVEPKLSIVYASGSHHDGHPVTTCIRARAEGMILAAEVFDLWEDTLPVEGED